MVTTFSLVLMSFGQNGYAEAIIQRDEMDHVLASNLFWINVGAGLLLAVGFAAAGPLLAKFYGDPRVAHIAAFVSLTDIRQQHFRRAPCAFEASPAIFSNFCIDVLANIVSVVVVHRSLRSPDGDFGHWWLRSLSGQLPSPPGLGGMCRWLPRPATPFGWYRLYCALRIARVWSL